MDNNKIIMILVIILIILIVAGFFILNPSTAKTDSKIVVTSNSTLHDGESFSIRLTDVNNTPITNQNVNITIIDAKGGENHQVVTTDTGGNGILTLNGFTIGNYTVQVNYGGNENYTSCNTTVTLNMEEKVASTQLDRNKDSSSSSNSGNGKSYGSYINDEWVPMSESEYANRYPVLYHQQALREGKYDQYHPSMYEVDRQKGYI